MSISEGVAGMNAALAMLPAQMDSESARVLIIAFGLQESRFEHRYQIVSGKPVFKGPARGFFQFERMGGCLGVVSHSASRYWMNEVCQARGVAFNATALWRAIENDDVLSAAAARLLIFTDPRALPAPDDANGAWRLYMRTWRPGRPKRKTFYSLHEQARLVVALP